MTTPAPEPNGADSLRLPGPLTLASMFGAGLIGAVVGAAGFVAAVVATGELHWLAYLFVGFTVGFGVRLAQGETASLAARTVAGVMGVVALGLSEYGAYALYDGVGFAPSWVPLAEVWDALGSTLDDDPVFALGGWGTTVGTAVLGPASDEEEDPDPADADADAEDGPESAVDVPEESLPVAQLVGLRPRRDAPSDVEVAVVFEREDGRFVHRRLVCGGPDLLPCLDHLARADSEPLARAGDPARPPRVTDQVADTAVGAVLAAHTGRPPAEADGWFRLAEFAGEVRAPQSQAELTQPQPAVEVGAGAGWTAGAWLLGLAAAAVGVYLSYRADVALGLDTSERRGGVADTVFTAVALTVSVAVGAGVGLLVAQRSSRMRTAAAQREQASWDSPNRPTVLPPCGSDAGPEVFREGPPSSLRVRPASRFVWVGVWTAIAAAIAATPLTGVETSPVQAVGVVAAVAALLGVGVAGLRMGVDADERGVTVRTVLRTVHIPWSELESVTLEPVPADVSVGIHRLVLSTRGGRPVVVAAPTGLPHPGGRMDALRRTLMRMRYQHTRT